MKARCRGIACPVPFARLAVPVGDNVVHGLVLQGVKRLTPQDARRTGPSVGQHRQRLVPLVSTNSMLHL